MKIKVRDLVRKLADVIAISQVMTLYIVVRTSRILDKLNRKSVAKKVGSDPVLYVHRGKAKRHL